MIQAFAYHRAVAPLMWVFVVIASLELVVTHLLTAMWWPRAAVALSAITVTSIIWLIGGIRSCRRLPVLLDADRLVMRVGTIRQVDVPRAHVAGVRESWNAAALKRRGVVKLSLIAYPNIVIDLDPPLPTRRGSVTAVAHRLDDPGAFRTALAAWLKG